jgi:hypothetical protein
MSFIILCALVHTLPAPVLNELGQLSDLVSDLSPEFIRGIEHIVFSMLLN